jgi:prophage regulatory protein
MHITPTNPRRIMRITHVQCATGFSRAWIYELMKRGDFPQTHKIGQRAVGWDSHAIEAWIAKQLGEVQ